ncbi:energy coupling factor transporter S component ThiW [Anaerolentibacter hominis]|uniref:energy coupling factor transporter S component ThiW n=1 Tax=Anaerolentibacter hominis TaxID=3079009 RepID=UPI0031B89DCB
MKKTDIKKLALAGILAAVAVVCSPLSIPVGASKCFPVQHFVNVMCGVFLGPWYGFGAAFVTSLIRNLMGTGTLLAFPGSMFGALLCGYLYRLTKKIPFACIGELVGTSIIGALAAYPVASLVMGKEAALFAYVIPFLVSSLGGTIIAAAVIVILSRAGVMKMLKKEDNAG